MNSTRAFATGSTGSGKTYRLRTLFAERAPRVLVLDFLGSEWPKWAGAVVVESAQAAARALARAARHERWRIVWLLDPEDDGLPAILQLLAPGPGASSYAASVGGMALLCDEVADLVPNGSGERSKLARRLWRWGRHAGLSIFAGTQRLPDVHRTVTSQSRYLICCPQHEPRDLETLSAYLSPAAMAAARVLAPRQAVLWDVERRRGALLAPDGRILQPFDVAGAFSTLSRQGQG